MSPKIKDYLGIVSILVLIVVAYGVLSYVGSYANTQPATRMFSVSGEGKAIAVPDIAVFTFGIIDQGGTDIAKIKVNADAKSKKVTDYLKGQGIDSKDIQSTGYNIEPRYQYSVCGPNSTVCPPPTIVGYTINQNYAVKIRDNYFAKIGEIISGVVTAGANNVSQMTFKVDDETKYRNEARTEAMEKAQAQAKAIAKAGGFKLGRLVGVDESGYAPVPFYAAKEVRLGMGGDMAVSSAPSIEPGSQEINVTVNLRYEIR